MPISHSLYSDNETDGDEVGETNEPAAPGVEHVSCQTATQTHVTNVLLVYAVEDTKKDGAAWVKEYLRRVIRNWKRKMNLKYLKRYCSRDETFNFFTPEFNRIFVSCPV